MKLKLLGAAFAAVMACAPASAAMIVYNFTGTGDRSEGFSRPERIEFSKSNVSGFFAFDPSLSTLDSNGNRVFSLSIPLFSQQLSATVIGNSLTFGSSAFIANTATERFSVTALFEDGYLESTFPEMIDFSKVVSSSYSALTTTNVSGGNPVNSQGALTSLSAVVVSGSEPRTFDARLVTTMISGVPEPTTWAMMLIGFGAVGYSMRTARQNRRVSLA